MTPTKCLLLKILIPLALFMTACGSSQNSSSKLNAFVTEDQAEQAFKIAQKTMEYLPYGYQNDGCYARSLFISLELAAEGIPSTSQYASCTGFKCIAPSGVDWKWDYHVAPMIIVSSNPETARQDPSYLEDQISPQDTNINLNATLATMNQPIIIDPGLSTKPLSRQEWVQKMNLNDDVIFTVKHARDYSSYDRETNIDQLVRSIQDMKKFKKISVMAACQTMWSYLQRTGDHPQTILRKRNLLINRTKYLLKKLKNIDLLESADQDGYCGFLRF